MHLRRWDILVIAFVYSIRETHLNHISQFCEVMFIWFAALPIWFHFANSIAIKYRFFIHFINRIEVFRDTVPTQIACDPNNYIKSVDCFQSEHEPFVYFLLTYIHGKLLLKVQNELFSSLLRRPTIIIIMSQYDVIHLCLHICLFLWLKPQLIDDKTVLKSSCKYKQFNRIMLPIKWISQIVFLVLK